MTALPRLTLAVDNCFASKRWTEPHEWMQIAADAAIFALEASADNECDPLYTPPDALEDWARAVEAASAQTGARVVNFYSGHGTYATLGLAHTDVRVRDHIQHRWLTPMIALAARFGAGLGFYCHAFPQQVMNDTARYAQAEADLVQRLAALAATARAHGLPTLSVEQMYSPHQIPWTIRGAERLLRDVFAIGERAPLYLTLDSGHWVGQRHFLAAQHEEPRDELRAQPEDGDFYAWLTRLAPYSPIIHLQQTDGTSSAHKPFTAANNARGVIDPARVLDAIRAAYAQPIDPAMPPRVTEIALTLEIFSPTAEPPAISLAHIQESAAYWLSALHTADWTG